MTKTEQKASINKDLDNIFDKVSELAADLDYHKSSYLSLAMDCIIRAGDIVESIDI